MNKTEYRIVVYTGNHFADGTPEIARIVSAHKNIELAKKNCID